MRNPNSVVPLLVAVVVILAVAWYFRTHPPSLGTASPSGSEAVQAHVGPPDIYPDPARTPGATNPEITQENIRTTICNPRWSTKSVRPEESYTHRLKNEQIGEKGESASPLKEHAE